MADHTDTKIHRGQSVSGRGWAIAGIILVVAIIGLSFLGTSTVPPVGVQQPPQAAPVPID